MFPAETAQSMYDFRANDVIGKIAPRPMLLLHSSDDHVTPIEQSIEMFERAGQPADLHLFADTDHFMFAEGNTRVHHVMQDWLANYFPVEAKRRRRRHVESRHGAEACASLMRHRFRHARTECEFAPT